jgi:hypothetical protein
MGPLSAKQHREYLAFMGKEQREQMKLSAEEARKDELHRLKLLESAAKLSQGVVQRDDTHKAKMKDMDGKPTTVAPRLAGPLSGVMQGGAPTNPEAGPSDTVPTMLTPGEAVIPAEAAQHPDNKPIIEDLVQQGRDMQGFSKGTKKVKPKGIGGKGVKRSILPNLPKVNSLGFEKGTTEVKPDEKPKAPLGGGMAEAARKLLGLRGRQIDQAVDKATRGYSQGTTGVPLSFDERTKYESSGNPVAKNPNSSAFGLHQMTTAAVEDARRFNPALASVPYDANPDNQKQYVQAYEGYIGKQVGTDDKSVIDKAWFVGPGGYKAIANADPSTPLEKLLSPNAIKHNKALQGTTAGEFMSRTNPYARSNGVPKPQGSMAPIIPGLDSIQPTATPSTPEGWNRGGNTTLPSTLVPPRAATGNLGSYDPTKLQPIGRAEDYPVPPVANVNVEDGTDNVVPETPDVVADKAVNVLNDDYSQEVLEKAMQTYREIDPSKPQEQESFLTRMFESIYGKSGLFREQDIGRFALLAAGGILTGGSIAGSVKYAAMDALQRGDARHQGEAASEAAAGIRKEKTMEEDQKNSRELHEQIKLKIPEYLAKNVSPEVRQKALDMGRKPAKTLGELIARDRSIVEFLAANVQHNDPNDKSPFADKPSTGYLNGNPVQYFNVNGKVMISDYKGGVRELTDQDRFLDGGAFKDQRGQAEKQIEDQLRPSLKLAMGKEYDEDLLKSIRSELMYTWSDMGGMDLMEFAKVSSGLAEGISKQELKTAPGEAIRKAFYGKAVVAINPSAEKYLKTPEGGKPSVMGLAKFGDAIQSELRGYNRLAAKKKIDPIDVGVFSNKLIDDFEKNVPPAIKDEMFSRARAQTDPKDKHFGMSPFMIWVAMGMPTESPKK